MAHRHPKGINTHSFELPKVETATENRLTTCLVCVCDCVCVRESEDGRWLFFHFLTYF